MKPFFPILHYNVAMCIIDVCIPFPKAALRVEVFLIFPQAPCFNAGPPHYLKKKKNEQC